MHLSGAVSSLSFNNYALKETPVDNTGCYGKDGVNSVMQNCCGEDLLGSISDEKYAADNLERIQKICAAGGFSLTKFISNRKELLMNMQEMHKRGRVKDANLTKD